MKACLTLLPHPRTQVGSKEHNKKMNNSKQVLVVVCCVLALSIFCHAGQSVAADDRQPNTPILGLLLSGLELFHVGSSDTYSPFEISLVELKTSGTISTDLTG